MGLIKYDLSGAVDVLLDEVLQQFCALCRRARPGCKFTPNAEPCPFNGLCQMAEEDVIAMEEKLADIGRVQIRLEEAIADEAN